MYFRNDVRRDKRVTLFYWILYFRQTNNVVGSRKKHLFRCPLKIIGGPAIMKHCTGHDILVHESDLSTKPMLQRADMLICSGRMHLSSNSMTCPNPCQSAHDTNQMPAMFTSERLRRSSVSVYIRACFSGFISYFYFAKRFIYVYTLRCSYDAILMFTVDPVSRS